MTLVQSKNIIQHLWKIHRDEYQSYQIWNSTGCVSIQQFNHMFTDLQQYYILISTITNNIQYTSRFNHW